MSTCLLLKFNVGGKIFVTTRSTIFSKGENYFTGLIRAEEESTLAPSPTDENGHYFIDRNPKAFGVILEFLRTGVLAIPPFCQLSERALDLELDFYQVQVTGTQHTSFQHLSSLPKPSAEPLPDPSTPIASSSNSPELVNTSPFIVDARPKANDFVTTSSSSSNVSSSSSSTFEPRKSVSRAPSPVIRSNLPPFLTTRRRSISAGQSQLEPVQSQLEPVHSQLEPVHPHHDILQHLKEPEPKQPSQHEREAFSSARRAQLMQSSSAANATTPDSVLKLVKEPEPNRHTAPPHRRYITHAGSSDSNEDQLVPALNLVDQKEPPRKKLARGRSMGNLLKTWKNSTSKKEPATEQVHPKLHFRSLSKSKRRSSMSFSPPSRKLQRSFSPPPSLSSVDNKSEQPNNEKATTVSFHQTIEHTTEQQKHSDDTTDNDDNEKSTSVSFHQSTDPNNEKSTSVSFHQSTDHTFEQHSEELSNESNSPPFESNNCVSLKTFNANLFHSKYVWKERALRWLHTAQTGLCSFWLSHVKSGQLKCTLNFSRPKGYKGLPFKCSEIANVPLPYESAASELWRLEFSAIVKKYYIIDAVIEKFSYAGSSGWRMRFDLCELLGYKQTNPQLYTGVTTTSRSTMTASPSARSDSLVPLGSRGSIQIGGGRVR